MILKERDTDEGLLVAVCDEDVLGETFEDGDVSLTVSEEFYGGEPADEQTVVDTLARASVANIVGTEAVELAIREGFVEEANVLDIENTRHAQFLRM
ncbi:DUF424 domain-containing protein [Halobacteriales archaeon QS_1_67_19]|nr:MAG: DUF424 domain-containing protein [Halobacteriales archaeon QS_1_67_19]